MSDPGYAQVLLRSQEYPQVVCVQGLGFVGVAMATAIASARDDAGLPRYLVIGLDLPIPVGRAKVEAIGSGQLPFATTDEQFKAAFVEAVSSGNLVATTDERVLALGDVTVIDIHLDLDLTAKPPKAALEPFRRAIATVGKYAKPGSLVLVETTVPPGTTATVVQPTIQTALADRGLPADCVHIAHSYERVMPGPQYFDSIVRFWRVYAGTDESSAEACAAFLETVILTEEFPLTRLSSTTASETAKVLENSYRAMSIAFMDEWGRFAESLAIDLFEVIEAIRVRPTHSNIREPGLGVGGYCLTKDPAFPQVSLSEFFPDVHVDFPLTTLAMQVNSQMPLATVARLEEVLGGSLSAKHILLMGIAYRPDVEDTRYSASIVLAEALVAAGAVVHAHDPLAHEWPLEASTLTASLPAAVEFDAIVFTVAHSSFITLDIVDWLGSARPWIVDANHVLTTEQRTRLSATGYSRIFSIGRGFQ
jgi:nucleotide sugar dehydrogenase